MIIFIATPKGGSGKTTTLLALASLLVRNERKVAVLDLDRNACATLCKPSLKGVRFISEVKPRKGETLLVDCNGNFVYEDVENFITTQGDEKLWLSQADLLLLPTEAIDLSTESIRDSAIGWAQSSEAPLRVLFTKFRGFEEERAERTKMRGGFPDLALKTTVPYCKQTARAFARRQSVIDFAPESKGAKAYEKLYKELFV